jgi:protein-tyrosine phosphatase
MPYSYNQISDHLFQGAFPPPGAGLKKAGFDVLVLCAAEHQRADMYPGLTVIKAGGDDDARYLRMLLFIQKWKQAAAIVVEHVRQGHNVLVTCMAGQNRSGLVVGLALVELMGLTGKEAVEYIRGRRALALNNETFAQYLVDNFPGQTEEMKEDKNDPLP